MIAGVLSVQIGVEYRPSLQTLHLGLFAVMTVLSLSLAYWIDRTRRTRGGNLFVLTLVLFALRAGSDVVHGLVGELWTLQTVLVALNPLLELCTLVALVRFAAQYAEVERLDDDRALSVLVALPVLAAAAIVTNPWHSLVFASFDRIAMPFTHVTGSLGVGGFALAAVNGTLLLVGAALLAKTFTSGNPVAWWPSILLAIGVGLAFLVGGLQLRAGAILLQYDYHAVALGGFVLLTTAALLDHGFRRIEVVAREAILGEIEDAVVLLETDGSIVDVNPAARRQFSSIEPGVAFDDRFDDSLVPDVPKEIRTEITLEADAPLLRDAGTTDPNPEDSNPEGESGAGHVAAEDSSERHFLVHTTPVMAVTGDLLGYAVRFVDVTELERRSRELARKHEQLDQFAATVSHDLRNPLNVASGHVELASAAVGMSNGTSDGTSDGTDPHDEGSSFDPDGALDHLRTVSTSLERMNVIIADILALIENTDEASEEERVDFERIATDAWDTVDTGRARLRTRTGGFLDADPDHLQRLLENLFRNAIDHVGEDVTIEIGLAEGSFFVADDGPGIPEEDRDQIFEHGYTTGSEGTGLGLSIVRQLADAHGWTVRLDPDHDGARFVVEGCDTSVGSAMGTRTD